MPNIMAFIESCIDLASLQLQKGLETKANNGHVHIRIFTECHAQGGPKINTNKHTSSLLKCMFYIKHAPPFTFTCTTIHSLRIHLFHGDLGIMLDAKDTEMKRLSICYNMFIWKGEKTFKTCNRHSIFTATEDSFPAVVRSLGLGITDMKT